METPVAMFTKLCKEIEIEFSKEKLDSKEKVKECEGKTNNVEFWDMRYLKNHIFEYSQYY